MNVLEVVEACNAGVGRHVRGLCGGLVAQGHRVTIAYSPRRMDDAFREFVASKRGEINFVPMDVGRKVSPMSDLRSLLRLTRLVRSEDPPFDVVHGHSSKGGAIARVAGRLSGVPTVYTPNSLIMASPEISRAERAAYTLIERGLGRRATSKFISVSEDEREFVLKLNLVPGDSVTVIPNAIDDSDFQYFSEEGTYEGVERRPLTFGSTMRFSAQKAPGHLIEAFALLNEQLPQLPLRLIIAGDGELFDEVRRQVEASGLREKISLLGWKTNVGEVLRELDVFVVSSAYESGLSYSTMEAMAARLPVVSTSVFGTRKTITQVPGNILVPVGNPRALADGMKRMATMTEYGSLRRALLSIGQANRDYVRLRFMQSEITRRTIEVYRTLR